MEVVLMPTDIDKLTRYCFGQPSELCPFCNKPLRDCIGHNVGLYLNGFSFVPGAFLVKMRQILNKICLWIAPGGVMGGCCVPRKKGSLTRTCCSTNYYGPAFKPFIDRLEYGNETAKWETVGEYLVSNSQRYSSFRTSSLMSEYGMVANLTYLIRGVYPLLTAHYIRQNQADYAAYNSLVNSLRSGAVTSNLAQFVRSVQDDAKDPDNKPTCSQFNGKNGLYRGKISGKQVNSICRAVCTASNGIRFGTIALSSYLGRGTTPILVMPHMVDYAAKMLLAGRVILVVRGDEYIYIYNTKMNGIMGDRINGKVETTVVPRVGDIIFRILEDGDVVLYNRQPTLHKASLMGGTVTLHKNPTVGIHSTLTTGLGADFDGDEMNMHVPVTVNAIFELRGTYHIINNLMSAKGAPVYAPVFHDILALYLISGRLDESIPAIEVYDADLNLPVGATYRDLLSAMYPPSFSTTIGSLIIRDGRFVSGRITKDNFGCKPGTIVHRLMPYVRPKELARFIHRCTTISNVYMRCNVICPRFSEFLGVSHRKEMDRIEAIVAKLGASARFERVPYLRDRIEAEISESFRKLSTLTTCDKNGILRAMVDSGARGNTGNLTQLMVCAGQQYSGSQRIDGSIMPIIIDQSAVNEGFIGNSYASGLTVAEYLAGAVAGRESIISSRSQIYVYGDMLNNVGRFLMNSVVSDKLSIRAGKTVIVVSMHGGLSCESSVVVPGYGTSYINYGELLRLGD